MATKAMSAWEARRHFGKLLDDVSRDRQSVIVESHGKPVAAVVPLHILNRYREDLDFFLETARVAAGRANLSPEEAMEIALREVAAHRAEQREAEEAAYVASGG
jgi:prevent-host-death family protein